MDHQLLKAGELNYAFAYGGGLPLGLGTWSSAGSKTARGVSTRCNDVHFGSGHLSSELG